MRRREFIAAVSGAAAWPLVAHAQQPERMRHVSVLMAYVESDATQLWTKVFSESLQELGWIIGQNVQLDFHWPGRNEDRLRADATEMVSLNPDVLMAVTTPAEYNWNRVGFKLERYHSVRIFNRREMG